MWRSSTPPSVLRGWVGWIVRGWVGWIVAGAALVVGVGAWSLRPMPRQYSIVELSNFIGSRVRDTSAAGGQAISTAGDEDTPGVLAATGPESWPAGRYRWSLSLKAGGVAAGGAAANSAAANSAAAGDQANANVTLATVTIRSPRQAITGFPAQVVPGSVPADGRFHTLEVEFDNPIHQSLVFELDATGAGPLESQGFQVSPIP